MATALPLVNVTVRLVDQDGDPVIGAKVSAKLTTVEKYQGYVIPEEYLGITDDHGTCIVRLFPNELGTEGSEYRFKISYPKTSNGKSLPSCHIGGSSCYSQVGKSLTVYASIPNADCNLEDVCDLDPYPIRGSGQILTEQVLSAAEAAKKAAQDVENITPDIEAAKQAAITATTKASIAESAATTAGLKANESASKAAESSSWASRAKAWAESTSMPDPYEPDSKSAKSWASQSRAWAESPTSPDPNDPNSKSAKSWSDEAKAHNEQMPVTSTGTTTPRPLTDRFADVVNVKDFGAVGDGVTDDTEAIQAAVNAGANGTPVFFSEPDVTYLTSAPIVIPSGVSIIGTQKSNYGKPTIKYTGTDAAIISGEYGSIGIRGESITNFHVKLVTEGSTGYRIHHTRDARWTGLMCSYDADNCTGFLFDGTGGGVFDCTFMDILSFNDGNSGIQHFELRGDDSSSNSGRVNANAFIRLSARGAGHGYKIGPSLINGFYSCLGEALTDGYIHFLSGAQQNAFYDSYLGDSDFLNPDAQVVVFDEGSTKNAVLNARFSGTVTDRITDNGSLNYVTDFYGRILDGTMSFRGKEAGFVEITKDGIHAESAGGKKSYVQGDGLINNLMHMTGGTSYNDTRNIVGNSYTSADVKGANLYFSSVAVAPAYPDGALADGVYNSGQANRRWNNIYASVPSINTSDVNEKQSIEAYPYAVLDAWGDVELRQFLFKDAVKKKGDAARIHAGVIAQQVVQAFKDKGLDATRYGLLCYDEWPDEYETVEVVDVPAVLDDDGNEVTPAKTHTEKRLVTAAGDRYGIRYSEALCMEAAYQRRRADMLEQRIVALEEAIKKP